MPYQHDIPLEGAVNSSECACHFSLAGGVVKPTYSTGYAAQQIGASSERWVIDQIRSGRFTARKIGRTWRMTEQDIAEALDACRNTRHLQTDTDPRPSGSNPTSNKRLGGAVA